MGLGKAGENTWSARLSQSLREKGFESADFEMLFPTLVGVRKPDVVFNTSSGICLISAKMGSPKEAEAIATAQEYQQTIGKIGKVAETFSITYPLPKEKKFHLRVLANNEHSSYSWILTDLQQAADTINEFVVGKAERQIQNAESSLTAAIRVLRNGVQMLSTTLTKSSIEDFESLFGGKHFFESVTGYDTIEKNVATVLRSAAAYIFVNQVLFYQILSKEAGYKSIEEQDYLKPEILKEKYYNIVLKKDYAPIYDFDISGKIKGNNAKLACKQIILSMQALFPENIDHDIIGKVFHNIIPLEIRKVVAAYFTNNYAGDLLARLAIQDQKDKILDPACGSGTLLVSSYKRKLELTGKPATKQVHKRFLEKEITGIDIMPFSAHLAAVNLALLAPLYETDDMRIAIDDSTRLGPNMTIDAVHDIIKEALKNRKISDYFDGAKIDKPMKAPSGIVSLTGRRTKTIQLEQIDVVVMNPPFTSSDNLPDEYKKVIRSRFAVVPKYEKCLTGKLSFQAYFLLLADKFLKKDGYIASVLPVTTLTGKAFSEVVKFLVQNFTIKYIIVGSGRSAFSDNTALSELLLVAEKKLPQNNNKFVLMATKKSPSEWSKEIVEELAVQAENSLSNEKDLDTVDARTRIFRQQDLDQSSLGFSYLMSIMDERFARLNAKLEKLIRASDYAATFADVEKELGINIFEGGAFTSEPIYGYSAISFFSNQDRMKKNHDLFIITSEKYREYDVMNRFTNDKFSIPKDCLCPQVRRLSGIKKMDSDSSADFVAYKNFSTLKQIMFSIYDKKTTEKYLDDFRNHWSYKITSGRSHIILARRIDITAPGTALLSVFSKEKSFVAANAWGMRNVNIQHAKILVLWFNSSLFLLELLTKRAQTRGSWGQIDKRYIEKLTSPALDKLDTDQIETLIALFEEIMSQHFPSIVEQLSSQFELRRKIDRTFLNLFGVTDKMIQNEILNDMYFILSKKLSDMKDTMSMD